MGNVRYRIALEGMVTKMGDDKEYFKKMKQNNRSN